MIQVHLYLRWGYLMEFNICGTPWCLTLSYSEPACSLLHRLPADTSIQWPLQCHRGYRDCSKAGIHSSAPWILMTLESLLGSQNLLKYARRLSGPISFPNGNIMQILSASLSRSHIATHIKEASMFCYLKVMKYSTSLLANTSTSSKTEA